MKVREVFENKKLFALAGECGARAVIQAILSLGFGNSHGFTTDQIATITCECRGAFYDKCVEEDFNEFYR